MRVMTRFGFIFEMCRRDGDTSFSFFGSFIDGAIFEKSSKTFLRLSFGDGSR